MNDAVLKSSLTPLVDYALMVYSATLETGILPMSTAHERTLSGRSQGHLEGGNGGVICKARLCLPA